MIWHLITMHLTNVRVRICMYVRLACICVCVCVCVCVHDTCVFTSDSLETTFFTTAGNRSAQSLPLATIYRQEGGRGREGEREKGGRERKRERGQGSGYRSHVKLYQCAKS